MFKLLISKVGGTCINSSSVAGRTVHLGAFRLHLKIYYNYAYLRV